MSGCGPCSRGADAEQLASEVRDYYLDFARHLAEGEAIASVVWTIEQGAGAVGSGAHAPSFDGSIVRGWLSEVEIGDDIVFRATITTDASPARSIADEWIIRPVLRLTRR